MLGGAPGSVSAPAAASVSASAPEREGGIKEDPVAELQGGIKEERKDVEEAAEPDDAPITRRHVSAPGSLTASTDQPLSRRPSGSPRLVVGDW